jgi:hypothetical protein
MRFRRLRCIDRNILKHSLLHVYCLLMDKSEQRKLPAIRTVCGKLDRMLFNKNTETLPTFVELLS